MIGQGQFDVTYLSKAASHARRYNVWHKKKKIKDMLKGQGGGGGVGGGQQHGTSGQVEGET